MSEERTAVSLKDVFWGRAVSPTCGDPSAVGEVRPEQLLPERVAFCFVLTSVLPFLANVTDLPP